MEDSVARRLRPRGLEEKRWWGGGQQLPSQSQDTPNKDADTYMCGHP